MNPRALPREKAAEYIGCCARTFDSMVAEGLMPPPRRLIRTKKVWDVRELDAAFSRLPHAGGVDPGLLPPADRGPSEWDDDDDEGIHPPP